MKTLYLGCSHSAGVWNDNEKVQDHIHSVPYCTSKIFGESWKSVSVPGHGVLTFASIIEHLIQTNRFTYENLIVQQTFEPRISLVNEKILFHLIDEYLNNDKDLTYKCQLTSYWSSYPRTEFEAKEHLFKTEKTNFLDYIEGIADQFNKGPKQGKHPDHVWVDMCYRYIKAMCDLHKVNFYSFAWDVSYRDTKYTDSFNNITFESFSNVRDWLKHHNKDYDKIVTKAGLHPKKTAVDLISTQLGKSLLQAGYK